MNLYGYSSLNQLKGMLLFLLCGFLLTGCIDLASQESARKAHIYPAIKGEVYTMRGGLGGVFSTGMNELKDTLERDYKIKTASTVWYKSNQLSKKIIKDYHGSKHPGPIVLVGHSLGANEQIKVSETLLRAHVPVALLITVETVLPYKIPPNVQAALNLYTPSPVFIPMFTGLKVRAEEPEFTSVDNIDVSHFKNISVNHFTIDKNKEVQKIMLEHVLSALNYSHQKQG